VTRLTVVPLRTGPSQGNDKNLGRFSNTVWFPMKMRIKANSGCACSQLLIIVGHHQGPESCANHSQATCWPLLLARSPGFSISAPVTVYRKAKAHAIPCKFIGRSVRFDPGVVAQWWEASHS
jgi:hypothetical protein